MKRQFLQGITAISDICVSVCFFGIEELVLKHVPGLPTCLHSLMN